MALASQGQVHVRIPFLAMSDAGHPIDLDVKLDAAPTLRALEPALDQLLRVALAVLESLELEPSQVHQVLLVGGQCAWPRVRERLESRFPGKVVAPNQPASAVAMGAARVAAQKQRVGSDAVTQKLQEPVSVMGAGGKLLRLFDRGAVLPARAELKLRVGAGAGLICPLVEGAALANGRGYLGAVALAGAEREVQLSAQIDARRILDVDLPAARCMRTPASRCRARPPASPRRCSRKRRCPVSASRRRPLRSDTALKSRGWWLVARGSFELKTVHARDCQDRSHLRTSLEPRATDHDRVNSIR